MSLGNISTCVPRESHRKKVPQPHYTLSFLTMPADHTVPRGVLCILLDVFSPFFLKYKLGSPPPNAYVLKRSGEGGGGNPQLPLKTSASRAGEPGPKPICRPAASTGQPAAGNRGFSRTRVSPQVRALQVAGSDAPKLALGAPRQAKGTTAASLQP